MDTRTLEQLAVPTPPYRARTPVARLAMAEDVPPKAPEVPVEQPTEQELDEKRAAEHAAALQAERDRKWEEFIQAPEKAIEKASEEIAATASVAKEKITSAPPIPEATPEISQQDAANKTSAVGKIEKAAAEGVQRVAAARKLIRTGTEVASDALREIQQGRKQPYRPRPNLPAEREVFASELEKTDLELGGLEAAGEGESILAKGLRDRIDVLQAQLEEITPRQKAPPARPGVGDIITEGKTKARILEVDATGRPTRLETIEKEVQETTQEEELQKEVISAGVQLGKELEATTPAQAPAVAPVNPEKRITGETQQEEFKKARDEALRKAEEKKVMRPQLQVDVAEGQGKGLGTGQGAGKPKKPEPRKDFDIEFKQPGAEEQKKQFVESTQEQWESERRVGEARRQKRIEEREALKGAQDESLDVLREAHESKGPAAQSPKAGQPKEDVLDVLREAQETEIKSSTTETRPESAPSAPVEVSSERGRVGETARQRTAEAMPLPIAERQEIEDSSPEILPERPTVSIEELGERKGIGFLERLKTGLAAEFEDMKAGIATALAQRQKLRLEARNKKIKEWEEKAKRRTEKGGIVKVLTSMLWDEQWASYHKWRGRGTYQQWERYNDARVRRENNRNEILNQGAARIDRYLDSVLERIDQYAILRDEKDSLLDAYHKDHKILTDALGDAEGSEKEEIRRELDELEVKMKEAATIKRDTERRWQKERRRAMVQQNRKESLLAGADRRTRPDTTPSSYSWLSQRITIPSERIPSPRKGAEKNQKLAA